MENEHFLQKYQQIRFRMNILNAKTVYPKTKKRKTKKMEYFCQYYEKLIQLLRKFLSIKNYIM